MSECAKCSRPTQDGDCYGCVVDRLLTKISAMTEWRDGASMESLRAYAQAVLTTETQA